MIRFLLLLALIAPALAKPPYTASKKAQQMAQEMIIVDGHIDVPFKIHANWADMTKAAQGRDFDYPRARAGGLNAPFMSIYIPAEYDDSAQSTQIAHVLIDSIEAMVYRGNGKYAIATSPAQVIEHHKNNVISLPLGMENGSPIQGDLSLLKTFYQRGIRYITLTHAKANHISDSSYDKNKKWGGLSPFGKNLIAEMNRLGIMIDISHVSDAAFWDALKTSKVPMIASHSSARHFTPGFERNMDDKMIKALANAGGVIMINFGSTFVTKEARQWSDTRSQAREQIADKYGVNSKELNDFSEQYRAKNPLPFATLDQVLDHIDHAVNIAGIDAVGLGSDFDGVGDSLPIGIKTVADYPKLIQGLLDRNYSDQQIEKILGTNALRVWQQVEDYAKQHQN